MSNTIQMDKSGRLVLPKWLREQLHLEGGVALRAEVIAGRIELTPIEEEAQSAVTQKEGILVLKKTGKKVDAGAAVNAERQAQEARGRRR